MDNRVKLEIRGINYYINTDESPEYTEELAKEIDERLAQILKGGSFISMTQAAVLVALEKADAAYKGNQEVESLKVQVKEYLEESAKAKSERDYYKRELERIKTEAKFKNDQINLFAGVQNNNDEEN